MMVSCSPYNDNTFAVRVNTNCRIFDFTLLFEDAFFSILPSGVFILLALPNLVIWRKETIKLSSYRFAIIKLAVLTVLFALHVIFLAYRLRSEALQTSLSLASSTFDIIAVGIAITLSFLLDQRAINASYLLTLYFSFASLLSIPRLRSLWLIHDTELACQIIWTMLFAFTVMAVFTESICKETILVPELREKASKEEVRGFWGRSLFTWIIPVFKDGYQSVLDVNDLYTLDTTLLPSVAGKKLSNVWNRSGAKPHRLLKATARAYFLPGLSAVIPRLILIVFKFCQPFLISIAVDFAETKSAPTFYGQAMIGAFVLEYFGMAITTSVYWRQCNRFATMIRAGLVTLIHSKAIRSKGVDVKGSQVITLMEVDADRIVANAHKVHETWANSVEIVVALWLLERQVGVACVMPALICITSVVATIPIAKGLKDSQEQWVQTIGQRVIVTAQIIGKIKVVKMLGLNKAVNSIVSDLREVELRTSHRFRKLLVLIANLSNIPNDFAPFATLVVYAIIAKVKGDESLLSARAFTSLTLITLLTSPLLTLIQKFPGLFQSVGCFDRIEKFCASSDSAGIEEPHVKENSSEGIVFENASFSWTPDSDPFLQNLDLTIKRQAVTMITGSVGSGKTALLESVMGETTLSAGKMTNDDTSPIAYCAQSPWLINDTIRKNITGPTEFDGVWYEFALKSSCLKEDLDRIPNGDMSRIGSGGLALSGGQKQRIVLARAIYSRADLIILDDIFAGIDSKNLSLLSKQLLGKNGYFRMMKKTVLMTTHHTHLLKFADEIIRLKDGQLSTPVSPLTKESDSDEFDFIVEEDACLDTTYETTDLPATTISINADDVRSTELQEQESDQSRQKGSFDLYKFYIQRSGVGVTACFIGAMIIEAAAQNLSSVWIQKWTKANESHNNDDTGMYLGVYAIFFLASSGGLAAGTWLLLITIIHRTAIRMHSDLLGSVLGAPFYFFFTTDTGCLVNRFSEDMTLIDMSLPLDAVNTVESLMSCILKTVIVCVMGKYFTATIPVLATAMYLIQRVYLRTSRQMRLLDIEAKSFLVTHFLELMEGVTTLRALGWSSGFDTIYEKHFEYSQRPFYMLYCIQQWLKLVLDLTVGAMAVVLVAITASLRNQFSGGTVGVALYMVITFNESLSQLINSWIGLETSIGAVSRVRSFLRDTPSESDVPPQTVEGLFPKGAIEFNNITASYDPSAAPVLKEISISIQPGEKVAVCGQSGSGKTSLILALLQMMPIQEGTIKVDGVDLQELDPDSFRAHLRVVSQDQFFLPGTIRFNMDPHNQVPDGDIVIENAIRQVGLWERVNSNGALDMELKPSEWSNGEKQLLALARSMVTKSQILILDEATSSVDLETEKIMQDVIDRRFKSETVISILHRFSHIHKFDRIIVVEDGRIIENGSPAILLEMGSKFRGLYDMQST